MKNVCAIFFALALLSEAAVVGDVTLAKPSTAPDEWTYLAAARSFHGGHWATSVRWLGELVERFPNSPRRSQAISLMAQAHYQMGAFREAYGVLSNNRLAAGDLADEYLYWMAECRVGQGNLEAADQIYAELLREHPESPRALEASIGMGFVSAQNEDWNRIISLLLPTESIFQKAGGEGFATTELQEGGLLLAEALLEQRDAEAAMVWVKRLPRVMAPERNWRRQLLQARIEMESGQSTAAFATLAALKRELSERKAAPHLHARVDRVHATLLQVDGQWEQAAKIYRQTAADKQRTPAMRIQSVLNAVRLYQHAGKLGLAGEILRGVVADSSMKGLHATSYCLQGELELASGGDAAVAQELFYRAISISFSDSLSARAQFGVGRCLMASGDPSGAHEAFFKVLEYGGTSNWVARVRYTDALSLLADGKLEEAGRALIQIGAGVQPELRDAARFLQLKSAAAQNDAPQTRILLEQARSVNSSLLSYSLLAAAQMQAAQDNGNEASQLLIEFRQQNPGAQLLAAAELENIRLTAAEGRWTETVALYNKWLGDYPNNALARAVKLDRAWALAQSGQMLNARAAYREIAKGKPPGRETYAAQMWLADQAFHSKTNRLEAERGYLEIAGATNSPPQLRQRALFMAGRAAMVRQGFEDARKIFQDLLNDKSLKMSGRIEATFALGDLTLTELGSGGEGTLGRLTQATNAFHEIILESPANAVAARAWGRIGDGCLLISRDQPGYLSHAEDAYRKSLALAEAAPVEVQSQSHLGLAYTLERSAAGVDAEARLNSAADHAMAVFYGRHLEAGEKVSAYWQTQSGFVAIRILERLKRYREAIGLCDELARLYPGLKNGLSARRKRFGELQE